MSKYEQFAQLDHNAADAPPQRVYNVPTYDTEHHNDGWSGTTTYRHTTEEVGATGCNSLSFKRVFFSVSGFCREAEWLFSLIAFATMADLDGFDRVSSFGFLLFSNVLTWLYIMIIVPAHLFDAHSRFFWLYLVELALDLLFCVFDFVAGIAAAAKCKEEHICDVTNKPKAAVAFSFLCSFALIVSSIISFRRYRNPPRGHGDRYSASI